MQGQYHAKIIDVTSMYGLGQITELLSLCNLLTSYLNSQEN